jgi:hypothetical protein
MTEFSYIVVGVCLVLTLSWVRTRFASFTAQRPQDYLGIGDAFDLRKHLNGPLVCEGVIYGPLGRVSSRFVGYFDCHWTLGL